MYDDEVDFSKIEKLLPAPTGYRILIGLPAVIEKTEGGIYKPEDYLKLEQTASIVGLVISVGPDAYSDKTKFPTGAWCKQGDWVMIRSYAGTRFTINKQEYRLINDDTIDGVVPDPRAIKRVGAA
jgi:co-chaperonin GroES (HSP10)